MIPFFDERSGKSISAQSTEFFALIGRIQKRFDQNFEHNKDDKTVRKDSATH